MTKTCNVIIRRVVFEPLKSCPFPDDIGIRELARLTGYDPAYLSKVKRGLMPITQENLAKIEAAIAKAAV